ncbi:zeta toxin family protein [Actinomadura sp. B10D3]|uniref:zeta toxin family protein n=1 Tax=Actinomadura sp. B10D3 TaxID=3153557 RepID=UPI00325F567B
MTTGPNDPDVFLPEEQAQDIFRSTIVPALLDPMIAKAPADALRLRLVLSGPAGAGKSELAALINPVHIDVDLFKGFHPRYIEMMRADEQAADELLLPDARRFFEWAVDHLVDAGVPAVIEHGLRDRNVYDSLMNLLTAPEKPQLPVEVAVMGTPYAWSLLGDLERYQKNYETIGFGRFVPEAHLRVRLEHLSTVADWADSDPRVSSVSVYRQGSTEPVFQKERGTPRGLRAALEAERQRPRDFDESRAFLRRHGSLAPRMTPEWRDLVHSTMSTAEPLLAPEARTGPVHDKNAVTFGRYQLVSIAHLDTVRAIAMDWPKVTVGVIDIDAQPSEALAVPPHLEDFYRDCDANTAPQKNPMTLDERISLWQTALHAAGLQDRVTVQAVPRPELDPKGFNAAFPSDEYDVVFPAPSGKGFDGSRNANFEEILDRDVKAVEPPLEYHTSTIRESYRSGGQTWRRAFAPGTLDTFIAMDGPRRLLGAGTAPSQEQSAVSLVSMMRPGTTSSRLEAANKPDNTLAGPPPPSQSTDPNQPER